MPIPQLSLSLARLWDRRIWQWAYLVRVQGPTGSGTTTARHRDESIGHLCQGAISGHPEIQVMALVRDSVYRRWWLNCSHLCPGIRSNLVRVN